MNTKEFLLYVFLAFLLTACAAAGGSTSEEPLLTPTQTLTPEPGTEFQTSDPLDLIGTWKGTRWGEEVNLYYYEDGSFAIKWPDSNIWIARGTYSFEGDQLVLIDQGVEDPAMYGIYRVYAVRNEVTSIRLRYELVSDPNEEAQAFMTEKAHTRIEP